MTKEKAVSRKNDNPNDLTEAEIAFLRGGTVPDEVKGYLARQHENIGTKITAYRKVAAAAAAECDAIIATQKLRELHGETVDLGETRKQLQYFMHQARSLAATVAEKDAEIIELTAGPAMAINSDD